MLEVPVFLYALVFVLISCIIPLLMLSRITRMLAKSVMKLIRSFAT